MSSQPPSSDDASLQAAIMRTVAYSDVFDMPVPVERLRPWLIGPEVSEVQLSVALGQLVAAGEVERHEGLLCMSGRGEVLAVHHDRSKRAAMMWPKAQRWGLMIGRLPFVRMVAITGGLACDSVADHDDIDLLIVTGQRRLWLTRLMIVAMVRAVGLRGPELCPNYLVSELAMSFEDRTVYVAREIAQMVPICGGDQYRSMLASNAWYRDVVGNHSPVFDVPEVSRGPLKKAVEAVLGHRFFDRLERWEMERKVKRLRLVESRRPEVSAPDESSFSVDVCKGHMVGNASGIDIAWHARLDSDA